MLIKNLPGILWLLLVFPIAATMMAQWLRYCLARNGNGKAYLQGLSEGMAKIGMMCEKRRLAKAQWKQPTILLYQQLRQAGRLYRSSKANRSSD